MKKSLPTNINFTTGLVPHLDNLSSTLTDDAATEPSEDQINLSESFLCIMYCKQSNVLQSNELVSCISAPD